MRLKRETTILHKLLEGRNFAKDIADSSLTIEQYKVFISRTFLFHQQVERFESVFGSRYPELRLSDRSKLKFIARDLAYHNIPIPQSYLLFETLSQDSWLGFLYVAEGSMLGGRYIKSALRENVLFTKDPFYFFSSYDSIGKRLWQDLTEFLEEKSHGGKLNEEEIINGAKTAYLTYLYITTMVH